MSFWSVLRESPNYPQLKNSVEYNYCKKRILILAVAILIFLVALLIPDQGDVNGVKQGILLVAGMVSLWLFFGYGCWPMVEMFLHISDYYFTEVTLQDINRVGYYGYYYTVEFIDRQGTLLRRNTSCMFDTLSKPTLEEYNGKRVLIGYNSKTDRVVVIRKVSESRQ